MLNQQTYSHTCRTIVIPINKGLYEHAKAQGIELDSLQLKTESSDSESF